MTTAETTPGSWEVRQYNDHRIGDLYIGPPGSDIAHVFHPTGRPEERMAAAPELLAVAEHTQWLYDVMFTRLRVQGVQIEGWEERQKQVHDAIAKARGEEEPIQKEKVQ